MKFKTLTGKPKDMKKSEESMSIQHKMSNSRVYDVV